MSSEDEDAPDTTGGALRDGWGYTDAEKENPDERPTPIPVNPDGIDRKLKSYPQWVVWRFVWRDGEWSKLPINPVTGEPAKSNDPSTAGSFQDALEYHQREDTDTDGIGFIVTESPFAGVDLDGVYDPENGEFDDIAEDVLETLGSYSEFSPSGRIVVRVKPSTGVRARTSARSEPSGFPMLRGRTGRQNPGLTLSKTPSKHLRLS